MRKNGFTFTRNIRFSFRGKWHCLMLFFILYFGSFFTKFTISLKTRLTVFGKDYKLSYVLIASVAQMVEHHLAKVDVEGSNPFARSKFYKRLADLMQELKSGRSGVVVKDFQELE